MNSHDGFPIAQCQPHADLLHFTAHSSPNCLTRRHFLKFCNFSPDSSTLLRYDSCNQITIESVEKIFESSAVAASDNAQISSSSSSILSISDTILSVDWFPLYDCQQAITKCFAVSSISTPIQIWDANYLQIRASYKLYRQQSDTLLHPNALCFSADGSRLFAGMKNSFAIFDTANPGSDFQEFVIYNRALDYGLGGLICCFGRTPQMPNVLAVATYDKQYGIFDLNSQDMVAKFSENCGIVSKIQFSDCGNYLLSTSRQNASFLMHDLRNNKQLQLNYSNTANNKSSSSRQKLLFDCFNFSTADQNPESSDEFNISTLFIAAVIGESETSTIHVVAKKLLDAADQCEVEINNERDNQLHWSFQTTNGSHQTINCVSYNRKKQVLAATSGDRNIWHQMDSDCEANNECNSGLYLFDLKKLLDFS